MGVENTMSRIFKYDLQITDEQVVEMPVGAKILTAQFQYEKLVLWAIVDDNPEKKNRKIRIVGTGHPFSDYELLYITTVQQYEGKLVWHIFEDKA